MDKDKPESTRCKYKLKYAPRMEHAYEKRNDEKLEGYSENADLYQGQKPHLAMLMKVTNNSWIRPVIRISSASLSHATTLHHVS